MELVESFHPILKSGGADLIIPLPLRNLSYQKVLRETFVSNADWTKKEDILFDNGKDKIRVLHAHWDNPAGAQLRLREILQLSDRAGVPAQPDPFFLKPTDHVQTDGIVKTTAIKATKGLTDPDQKAHAIYNWIVANTFRDPKIRGCGMGDAKSTLTVDNLGGKCADLNSLFVAMARASGVPAREVWGVRVAPSRLSKSLGSTGDVSEAQHCRAEYYSAKRRAWFPADAADVRKVILQEKLKLKDAHVQKLVGELFGRWEGNWVELNFGRDLRLPNGKKINYLMYPQLFSGKTLVSDGVDPVQLAYKFTARQL